MAIKRRNLFLFLTCFVGVIIVLFVDGYMGIYDTLYITAGEREQKIELHQWLRTGGVWSGEARWGEKAFFRYEINNRQFSTYSADIEVSLWHDGEEVRHLVSQLIEIAPFDSGKLEWLLDTVELEPSGLPPTYQAYTTYYVVIKSDKMERRLRFYISAPKELR